MSVKLFLRAGILLMMLVFVHEVKAQILVENGDRSIAYVEKTDKKNSSATLLHPADNNPLSKEKKAEGAAGVDKVDEFDAENGSLYRRPALNLYGRVSESKVIVSRDLTRYYYSLQETVEGRVIDEDTGDPMPGVNILVKGTTTGTSTDGDGRFQLTVENLQVTLVVTFIGYQQREISLNGRSSLDILLAPMALGLDEVIVTGAGITALKKQLGQSISEVSSEDLKRSGGSSIGEALAGRIPGFIGGSLGEVGSQKQIRLRGTVSLSQRNEPVIYIDGVRVDNDNSGVFGSFRTSMLAKLNMENVEKIEVLKGAAAATLYGTEASSGVIQITTKQGAKKQKPAWDLNMNSGLSYTPLNRFPKNEKYDASSGQIVTNFPIENYVNPGYINRYNLAVSGGGDNFNYYNSIGYNNTIASVPQNSLEDYDFVSNINLYPLDGMNMQFKLSYNEGNFRTPYPYWGLAGEFLLADPTLADPPGRPYGELYFTVPGALAYDNTQKTQLTNILGKIDYELNKNFRTHFLIGHNFSNKSSIISVPPGPSRFDPQGIRETTKGTMNETTLEANITWTAQPVTAINSQLTVGGQYYRQNRESISANVDDFSVLGISTLNGGSNITGVGENILEVINAGIYIQEQLGINERLFFTGGVRLDGNSTFGDDFGFQAYPHLGASWVISDESFWSFDVFDSFRVRTSYGVSGLQPGAFDKLRTWRTVSRLGGKPVLLPNTPGNTQLKPERSQEFEVGTEFALFSNRLNVDFTYYWQETNDAILNYSRPASEGFTTAQVTNLGALKGRGLELAASGMLLNTNKVAVELTGTYALRNQRITDLGPIPEIRFGNDPRIGNSLRVGYQPGAVIAAVLDSSNPYTLAVSDVSQLTSFSQVSENFLTDSNGNEIRQFIGNQLPTSLFSFGFNIDLPHNVRFSTLFNGATGFVMQNQTASVRTGNNITTEMAQLNKELAQAGTDAQVKQSLVDRYVKLLPNAIENWAEDGTYLQLQEMSLSWGLPSSFLENFSISSASLKLTGRNLLLFTGYSGSMDPGTTGRPFDGSADFLSNVDYLGFPTPREIMMSLSISF